MSRAHGFRLGFLLVDGFALMSYSAAIEPLRAANLLKDDDFYQVTHLAVNDSEARSSTGAMVPAQASLADETHFDLVLVAAGGDPLSFDDPKVFKWLRNLARRGIILGGISGGPAILARAGVMNGRRMTVHWEHAQALSVIMPSLLIERSLYLRDRDRITCAGGMAPLDMMHSLLAEHHGPAFARQISDWFMHTDIRPSSGPQRSGLVERYGTTSRPIILAIEAMENHIADPLNLAQLATLAGVGTRQLSRLFNEKLGHRTMGFYSELRLSKARNLLEQSALSITEIALASGFASSAHFSAAYKSRYGSSPSACRR